jgi:pimeloyl-ACP methyl ester carboxylesterase
MPTVDIDGITTHYEISGSGPSILMMAPGVFDSAIEKWSTTWPWQHFLPLQTFAREYTCIAYDRREAGQSGGRVGGYFVLHTRKYTEGIPWTLDSRANMRS